MGRPKVRIRKQAGNCARLMIGRDRRRPKEPRSCRISQGEPTLCRWQSARHWLLVEGWRLKVEGAYPSVLRCLIHVRMCEYRGTEPVRKATKEKGR